MREEVYRACSSLFWGKSLTGCLAVPRHLVDVGIRSKTYSKTPMPTHIHSTDEQYIPHIFPIPWSIHANPAPYQTPRPLSHPHSSLLREQKTMFVLTPSLTLVPQLLALPNTSLPAIHSLTASRTSLFLLRLLTTASLPLDRSPGTLRPVSLSLILKIFPSLSSLWATQPF